MSNNFDQPILLDQGVGSTGAPADYIGFGRAAGAAVSTGPRVYAGTGDPNGVLTAPQGSLWLQTDAAGVTHQNTDGGTTWTQLGNLSGAVNLTAVSSAGADLVWTMRSNRASSVDFRDEGGVSYLRFDTTANSIEIEAPSGLTLFDNIPLRLGTGLDLVLTPDGTNVSVAGTGQLIFGDDTPIMIGAAGPGATPDSRLMYNAGGNIVFLKAADATANGGGADTAALTVGSQAFTVNNAAIGSRSGQVIVESGATDSTDAGGTAGATGAVVLQSGASSSTAGTSGNTGAVTIQSGNSADGNSGDVTLATGTAGGTRGEINLNAPTVNLSAQATDIEIIDNSASALNIAQSTRSFIQISTLNIGESLNLGGPTITLNTVNEIGGVVEADGIDFGTRVVLNEEFAQPPAINGDIGVATNLSFEAAGLNMTSALVTAGGTTTNGWVATTAGGLNDQAIITPHLDAKQSLWAVTSWRSTGEITLKVNIRTIGNATLRLEAGLRPTTTAMDDGTDNDKFLVRFDTSDGVTSAVNWVVVTSNNGVDTLEDSGIAVAGSTQYRIVFAVDSSRQVSCFINGVLANTPGNHDLLNSVALGDPYFGVQALAAAGRAIAFQKIACAQNSF